MARPPTKHGLERKFKPWRRGKSDKKSATVVGSDKQRTNASLKNRLRGQKRLLAKLQKHDNDDNVVVINVSILHFCVDNIEMNKSDMSHRLR